MMKSFLRLLPAVTAALFIAISMPVTAKDNRTMNLTKVVIDPGHGGHDAGCISRDKKTYEKNLTLDISKRFAEKIRAAYPDIEVIMTRDDDRYVTLSGRADIANNANADLFISIHINAQSKGTAANGYSIHCLGQSREKGNDLFSKNLELCKRENSVIKLEDDYQTKYQGFDPSDPQSYIFFSLMQNAHLEQSLMFAEDVAGAMKKGPIRRSRGVSQDPFWVLWRTTMPSVLIEVGFITNPEDLQTMRSADGRDKIAQNLLDAFTTFKKRYDGTMRVEKTEQPREAATQDETGVSSVEVPSGSVLYGTQVLATGRRMSENDAFFRGNKPVEVSSGKLFKYVIGVSSDIEEARKEYRRLRSAFPESFFVRIEEGKTERVK